jgi:2-octaprenylphenol hydroxylase
MVVPHHDVVIVGGGIVGLTLANALKASGLVLAIVERHPPAAVCAAIDVRVSAINPAALRIFAEAGIDAEALSRRCDFHEMHVWDSTGAGQIHFDSAELGLDTLGAIIENSVLQQALRAALAGVENIHWYFAPAITGIDRDDDAWIIELAEYSLISGSLLIGADGAHSQVRQTAKIEYVHRRYQQQGVVATVSTEHSHQHTAWQCFMPSGPLALLPLCNGQSSIVWSLDAAQAADIMALDDAAFCRALEQASDYRLGAVTATSARAAFELGHGHVKHYVADRLALIGDAAHTIHPLAGQGANLGIADAAVLAQVITAAHAARRQWYSLATLRKYERARKGENRLMETSMTAFKTLFGNDHAALSTLRNAGLSLADRLSPLKTLFMQHAMGLHQC